jgi:serine/threonine-protein kinase
LGRGATADVYVVRQKFLRKKFAMKLLRPHLVEEEGHLERLLREARSLGKIQSPHVVRIIDLARAKNGTPYVVLDWMKGHSLAHELDVRKRLPLEEAVMWSCQALSGLGAAHAEGLIHRDVTPDNLFLQDRHGERILKVMDFGLARVLPGVVDSGLRGMGGMTTSTGTIVGSPVYASPEALRGQRLDSRSDIYGVGLVLFQMVTGLRPLELDGTDVPAPSSCNPSLPKALDAIVGKATRPRVDERYETAEEFTAALSSLSQQASAEDSDGR